MPSDRYQQLTALPPGRFIAKRLGLPESRPLRRYEPGQPALAGPALLGGEGRLGKVLTSTLAGLGAEIRQVEPDEDVKLGALVFDATGIADAEGLRALYEFFHEHIRSIGPSGRLVVLGTPPELAPGRRAAVAQRALEGFVRSLGKEVRHGATAQLVHAEPDADLESTLRFLLSGRSAYVSGQVIRVGAAVKDAPDDWARPLAGKVAAVTGASRGIGAAIAEVLARDGAHVVCIDVPAQGEDLAAVANRVGGSALQIDITSDRAPGVVADRGADIVVHNAGITRDKTLARMSEDQWDSVLAVNLQSIERINDALLEGDRVRRIVCVSSVSGIAGNRGQVNYATSKAGVIGVVEALADEVAKRQCTINAVAPGFIETRMTAAMPLATREAGRRMNSLAQGGLPVDVAETVAWFASPGSAGVNGNVVRVCGQSLIGA
jgi:3-oxoacyl-[acyl-carrier protein] reductase